MPRRWEDDDRGHGIGDATQLVPGANELVAAFGESDWVAEDPEIHLRPHVEAWCQRDQRLALVGENTDDAHAYVLDLEWRGANRSVGEARAAVLSLIGSFAESATYNRERRVDEGRPTTKLRFEVGTGELAPEAKFAPHGHVVLIRRGRRALGHTAGEIAITPANAGAIPVLLSPFRPALLWRAPRRTRLL